MPTKPLIALLTLLLPPATPVRAAPAAEARAYYTDTANPAAEGYNKDFNLRRDVFDAARAMTQLGRKVLLAWDIDLTLGTPLAPSVLTSAGSDPWWNEQAALLMDSFVNTYGVRNSPVGKPLWPRGAEARYAARFHQLIVLNARLHEKITLEPVEDLVPAAVTAAQAAGVNVMAITARSPEMEAATAQDLLQDIGVDFSSSAPGGFGFSLTDLRIAPKARPALYRGGVLMTAGQNKGEHLLHVLEKTGYRPDAVFFLDDSEKNVRDVLLALKNAGIEVHAVRYGHEDARVAAYRTKGSPQPCAAQAQLRTFLEKGTLPRDSEVKDARCDAASGFSLIYGSTAPAAAY